MGQISMKKDLWCHFDYEGHHIAVHFSIWSGKEVVYVDNHPASDKRNILRFTSRHNIEIDSKPLVIELEVENPFTYRVEVRLKKGARTLKRKSNALFVANKKTFLVLLSLFAGFIVIGGLTGYFIGRMLVG
jgi:hypothetical protein